MPAKAKAEAYASFALHASLLASTTERQHCSQTKRYVDEHDSRELCDLEMTKKREIWHLIEVINRIESYLQ